MNEVDKLRNQQIEAVKLRHNPVYKPDKGESELNNPKIAEIVGRNMKYVKAPNGTLIVRDMGEFISQLRQSIAGEIVEKVTKILEEIGNEIISGNTLIGKCPDCKYPKVKIKDSDIKVKETWFYKDLQEKIYLSKNFKGY